MTQRMIPMRNRMKAISTTTGILLSKASARQEIFLMMSTNRRRASDTIKTYDKYSWRYKTAVPICDSFRTGASCKNIITRYQMKVLVEALCRRNPIDGKSPEQGD